MKIWCCVMVITLFGVVCGTHRDCISGDAELKQSIFSKEKNCENLRRIFPPDTEPAYTTIEVRYHFSDHSLPQPYRFRWSSSWVLALLRPKVLQDLSFHVFNADVPTIDIEIEPTCETVSINSKPENWERICSDPTGASTTLHLLNNITAKVSLMHN